MAYEQDRSFGQRPVDEYHRTTIERESSGVTWVVIGLLFAAIVAAVFFLFRPTDPAGTTIIGDPTISAPAGESILAPAEDGVIVPDPAAEMAPAADIDAAPAPAADDLAPAAPAETVPAE